MASTYLTRTPSTNGNQKKWTWSGWIKIDGKSGDATYQYLLNCVIGSGYRYTYIAVRHGTIETYGGVYSTSSSSNSFDVTTNRLLRDPSNWYHVVVVYDSAQSTSTDRVKIYINGVQETSFQGYVGGGSLTYPAQNTDSFMNVTTTPNKIGENFNGSMSHVHFCDGYAYQPSDFASTDSVTGQWKINPTPSINYGTNGFWLFKDDAALTDSSGNSNNFTLGGGTLTKTEDSPSNVFATGNPLVMNPSHTATFSNGNNKIVSTAGGKQLLVSTLAANSGKFYAEYKADAVGGGTMIGVIPYDVVVNTLRQNNYFGQDDGSVCMYSLNGAVYNPPTASGITGVSYTDGDIIGVAVDLDNSYCYFHKNGTYINSGDPTSGATGTGGVPFTKGDSFWCFAGGDSTNAVGSVATTSANFGNGYFGSTAISSEGTNASGIGKFEYDVPNGNGNTYTALTTKGLNL